MIDFNRLRQLRVSARRDSDLSAGVGQHRGKMPAQSAGRAGDQRVPPVQSEKIGHRAHSFPQRIY